MSSTRPQVARSLHGCWTCRLRRKKCDETHPSCLICAGLKLECFGYGPRPVWMDGGMAEKEQAMRVKRTIKRNKRLSREHSQIESTPGSTSRAILTPVSIPNDSHPLSSLPISLDGSEQEWPFDRNQAQSSVVENLYCDEPGEEAEISQLSMAQYEIMDLEITSLDFADEIPTDSLRRKGSFPHENTLFEGLDDKICWPESIFPEESGQDITDSDNSVTSQQEIEPQQESTTDIEPRSYSQIEPASFVTGVDQPDLSKTVATLRSEPVSKICLSDSVITLGERPDEATLFMHYLDKAFYIQFPFYRSYPTQSSRGWILNLLMRDKSVYHAALALSQNHLYSTGARSKDTNTLAQRPRFGEEYHIMALRELQAVIGEAHAWVGTTGLIRRFQVLTCSLHLIHYELLNGAAGPWPMHLRAAANLVPQLSEALMSQDRDTINWRVVKDFEDARILSLEDRLAMSLVLSAFIWLDIMAGASIGSKPFLQIDHVSILESNNIHTEEISGCDNRVAICIFQISELRSWKHEAQSKGVLSIAELARRGSRIEQYLEENFFKNQKEVDIFQHTTECGTDSKCAAITNIFALSALNYIHITVSGSNHQLPEIAESCSKTIEAFKALPSHSLLRYLVWPFCVTACMASEEQKSFFRELAIIARRTETRLEAWKEALNIVENCWRSREKPGNHDWMTVMDQVGECIILA